MMNSLSALCLAAICACLFPGALAANNQTYASLAPPKYIVELAFPALMPPNPALCNSSAPGSSCLPLVQAGVGQSVAIAYAVNTTFAPNSTSTITLKGCYGLQSTSNRAWRKANPVISLDKQCGVAIAAGLPPQGEFTWKVGPNTAPAVYSVIALEVCAGGLYCGSSATAASGYFQVLLVNDRPTWLMVMAGCFAALGPLSLASFFIWENKFKAKKTV